jgi:plastocyanin
MRWSPFFLVCVCCACLPQVGPPVSMDGGGPDPDGGTEVDAGVVDAGVADCTDGLRNGRESDVDCGGDCPRCGLNAQCVGPADCQTGRCSNATCRAPASTCPGAFSGCTTFVDLRSDPNPTIRFPVGGDRYAPDCVRVRVGQIVTFLGDFGPHELAQSCGPVPSLVSASSGQQLTVAFTEGVGVYGFYCTQHGGQSGSGMAGAIEVVP